jgi:hypothetical protein
MLAAANAKNFVSDFDELTQGALRHVHLRQVLTAQREKPQNRPIQNSFSPPAARQRGFLLSALPKSTPDAQRARR